MIQSALIVCVGNICRSPMAEALLRHRLAGRDFAVGSAGLAALRGNPIDPLAEQVLAAHGLSAKAHIARQIEQALIDRADIVLTMEKRHMAALRALSPQSSGKIFLLRRWRDGADIPDPYGRKLDEFERAYDMIHSAMDDWISRV
ncbi:low molecular weight phosphotyrosine protein phosphatase [Luteimonas sp. SX5]|uniref:protein-tyrosine-phosphatase n=1 Tax=Luteimonas galliterrae TaxID=2940486 RepID=A0ABT0MJP4_9GAMM|nr:low molecular weight protein-tyrosine-phosphatase [Luteimonas galliterrae]MCL1634898.1 low molecular weight phosphotyrosine protein phosphatase [Luteimonas galliterrae]